MKLASGCSRIFTATDSDKTTGKTIMKIRLHHNREFVCVTENIVKETLIKNILVPFRILSPQRSKNTHKYISSCCCPLFVTVRVYREPNGSLSHSKTLSQIQNPRVLSIGSGTSSSSSTRRFGFHISSSVKRWSLGHGS